MVLIPNQSERHVEGKYSAPILGGVDVAAGQPGRCRQSPPATP
jgi:hypothetical protein